LEVDIDPQSILIDAVGCGFEILQQNKSFSADIFYIPQFIQTYNLQVL
jgi:hypothetical protein